MHLLALHPTGTYARSIEREVYVRLINIPTTVYMVASNDKDGGLLSRSVTLAVFGASSRLGGMRREAIHKSMNSEHESGGQ